MRTGHSIERNVKTLQLLSKETQMPYKAQNNIGFEKLEHSEVKAF